jgi:threonylcarbamoyladenosine tRNA methylthiotransferase MtaB
MKGAIWRPSAFPGERESPGPLNPGNLRVQRRFGTLSCCTNAGLNIGTESMPRASFQSVGCKLNSCEIELIERQFAARGYDIVPFEEPADVTIINTCTVTASSDADCRKLIRRAGRLNPQVRVVVTGCLAQRIPDELAAMPNVALVLGNGAKSELISHVESAGDNGEASVIATAPSSDSSFLGIDRPGVEIERGHLHTRATLQIQDGCDRHCTYCIIPSVRGPSRSRPLKDILADARSFVAEGYREIALTGVNSAAWGHDLAGDRTFVDVVRVIANESGIERLRTNSMEPEEITDELIAFLTGHPNVCRHFHVPLQSGSDQVLRRMGRRYRSADYRHIVERFAELSAGCALGADIMVGFPGETGRDFEDTYTLLSESPLTHAHIFIYSPREGTPSTRMDGAVALEVARDRSRRLRGLAVEKQMAFHQAHIGTTVNVLVEDSHEASTGFLRGLTDNYIRVSADLPPESVNTIVPVELVSATPNGMSGIT